MKMKQKVLGIVLTLVMLVSLMPSVGITYAAPDTGATYTVDTSATQTQAIGDWNYNATGTTATADGYEFTATTGDFDARVWVNGCPLGNQVNDGGLTISFTAVLPASNPGAVYYCYSAEQGNEDCYPFVGFKPVSGGYRLLSNMENGNDAFYNDTIYSGSVPVILYITPDEFELYVDGSYIATLNAESSLSLGERWFYAFKSFWAGNTETTLKVTDLMYLNGKAILEGGSEMATEAPSTQAPVTEVPAVTEEPEATEVPETTEEPSATEEPSVTDAPFTWVANLSSTYNQGETEEGDPQTTRGVITNSSSTGLYMKKTGTVGGFCAILWCDSFDAQPHDIPYTLRFNAKQVGGYAGNNWDGYAVSIRHDGGATDTEIIRFVPSAAGVELYVNGSSGTKIASIYDNNAHSYDVTFDAANNQITSIKVDGVEKLASPVRWTAPSSYHGIMVKSGHNDATGVELYLTEMSIVAGETEAVAPGATEAPTEAPSQMPTEAPTESPAPVRATISASLRANGGEISELTGSTTVTVLADATVTSGDDLDAILAIIVYDGKGKIVNIAYETILVDADVSTSVTKALEAGFNLPANIEGYKIQIAVYDNLVSLNQLASMSYTIE